ncbi:beta-N-acetylhexosaminidase [Plebeiibacterium marinum]|uniref:Family 20 glycosylhydrolase n=1 Tax=Plebeiibacterium marinum TaxID=2992111 RepID=A0AAE3MD00_9BACT|nr:family 20 glycosylhydrolase [Plebeiobacterium marinum]MCW3805302.1 family 20 glycosylhydrolase [Plebeiobacterium marinum]
MRVYFLLGIFAIITTVQAESVSDFLFPTPKKLTVKEGFLNKFNGCQYGSGQVVELIKKAETINIQGELKAFSNPVLYNKFTLAIDSTLPHSQQYVIDIDSADILIRGKDEAALFYGKQTLNQVLKYSESTGNPIPCLTITDWPDFERRGYMLDISRDKVPTMETLFKIIDMLARWKINEFQLYTEHTFAYKNHKVVWENCSPVTAEEVKILDLYCKTRFIDLVPNQNSFGHMENWLKHDEYLHLAECPSDCKTIWGMRKRTSLDPGNPESLELMKELYDELIPNFSSEYLNIGCDETVELGMGRSKSICDELGKGQVYLEYLKKLNQEVNRQNKISQFWGDIILNHPELIDSLPKNMIAMVWGYESDFPFNEKLPKFQKAGLDYYVCPGTSTWRSIIGRNQDAFLNLKNAAVNGKKYNAKGYLNTNWGDHGHWQPLSVCYAPMGVGAAYAWNISSKPESNIEFVLNQYIFKDYTENTAKAIMKLGNSYLACKIPEGNANAYQLMLRRYKWTMKGHFQTKHLRIENLEIAEDEINEALSILQKGKAMCEDAEVIVKELEQASSLAKHGIHLGIARLKAPNQDTKNIDAATKNELIAELEYLINTHGELWIMRNRIGGLQYSTQKMEDILLYYKD